MTTKCTRAEPTRFLRHLDALLRACQIAPARTSRRITLRTVCLSGERINRPGVSNRIERVLTFVDQHLALPLTVDDLAEQAGLSKYHFSRVFRQEVGQSPWAYVREARVERAKRLLDDGATPAEAALEAGFFDQSHLTRTMKAVEGTTPARFQESCGSALAVRETSDRTDVQDGR
jgi:AraC-like DNA-binding protein